MILKLRYYPFKKLCFIFYLPVTCALPPVRVLFHPEKKKRATRARCYCSYFDTPFSIPKNTLFREEIMFFCLVKDVCTRKKKLCGLNKCKLRNE